MVSGVFLLFVVAMRYLFIYTCVDLDASPPAPYKEDSIVFGYLIFVYSQYIVMAKNNEATITLKLFFSPEVDYHLLFFLQMSLAPLLFVMVPSLTGVFFAFAIYPPMQFVLLMPGSAIRVWDKNATLAANVIKTVVTHIANCILQPLMILTAVVPFVLTNKANTNVGDTSLLGVSINLNQLYTFLLTGIGLPLMNMVILHVLDFLHGLGALLTYFNMAKQLLLLRSPTTLVFIMGSLTTGAFSILQWTLQATLFKRKMRLAALQIGPEDIAEGSVGEVYTAVSEKTLDSDVSDIGELPSYDEKMLRRQQARSKDATNLLSADGSIFTKNSSRVFDANSHHTEDTKATLKQNFAQLIYDPRADIRNEEKERDRDRIYGLTARSLRGLPPVARDNSTNKPIAASAVDVDVVDDTQDVADPSADPPASPPDVGNAPFVPLDDITYYGAQKIVSITSDLSSRVLAVITLILLSSIQPNSSWTSFYHVVPPLEILMRSASMFAIALTTFNLYALFEAPFLGIDFKRAATEVRETWNPWFLWFTLLHLSPVVGVFIMADTGMFYDNAVALLL
ncbi:hypothetical protein HK101_010163 [Irineochytrium annulatum]|nr:hypothetical protein HK101_010163 [Irineochytrium annulatum]